MEDVPTWVLLFVMPGVVVTYCVAWFVAYCVSPEFRVFIKDYPEHRSLDYKAVFTTLSVVVSSWAFAADGSRDGLLFYNGVLVTVAALAALGLASIVVEHFNPPDRPGHPGADVSWTDGIRRYGLVHQMRLDAESVDTGTVKHHTEVSSNGYARGQVIHVVYPDTAGSYRAADAEVLSVDGEIRCRLIHRWPNRSSIR